MEPRPEFAVREGNDEIFVNAPSDEIFNQVFDSISPEAKFDPLLQEWRIPWSGGDTEKFIKKIKKTADKIASIPISSKISGAKEFGYAQVTHGEGLEIQADALREVGIPDDHIYLDRLYGRYPQMPDLVKCLDGLRAGDTIVVHNINRLGRSLNQLVDNVKVIHEKKACIKTLTEPLIDTHDPKYDYFYDHILFASEFEKSANRERTKAGLREAAIQGRRRGGRRTKFTREKLELAAKLIIDGETIDTAAKAVGTSRAAIYRQIPGGPDAIREAYQNEGQNGVDNLISNIMVRINARVTEETKNEIIQLYNNDHTIRWIADHINLNRETVRRVIEEAFK